MKGRFSLSLSSFHSAPSRFEISELCIFGFSWAIFRRCPRDHTINAFIGRLICSLCNVFDDISISIPLICDPSISIPFVTNFPLIAIIRRHCDFTRTCQRTLSFSTIFILHRHENDRGPLRISRHNTFSLPHATSITWPSKSTISTCRASPLSSPIFLSQSGQIQRNSGPVSLTIFLLRSPSFVHRAE